MAFTEWLQVGVENPDDKRRDLYPLMDGPFFQTIGELRPDALLLWGSEIAGDAGPGAWTENSYEADAHDANAGLYKLSDGFRVPAYFMTHPSARKSNDFFADEAARVKMWMAKHIGKN